MPVGALISGLLPVFAIIVTGYYLRKRVIPGEEQWAGIERTSFVLLIPCLIIETLAKADMTNIPVVSIAIVLSVSLLIVIGALSVLYRRRAGADMAATAAYTSVFQTSTRWNAFAAIAIVANTLGNEAVAITALGMIVLMPIINVVNVVMLTSLLSGKKVSLPRLIGKIAANPIIVGCAIGLIFPVTGVKLWDAVAAPLDILGEASLAMVLLSLGAGLRLEGLICDRSNLAVSCFFKLVLMPATTLGLSILAGLDGLSLLAAVIIASVPTATSGYVLAKEMGGDAALYANAASIQVLLSFITIPMWLSAAGALIG